MPSSSKVSVHPIAFIPELTYFTFVSHGQSTDAVDIPAPVYPNKFSYPQREKTTTDSNRYHALESVLSVAYRFRACSRVSSALPSRVRHRFEFLGYEADR